MYNFHIYLTHEKPVLFDKLPQIIDVSHIVYAVFDRIAIQWKEKQLLYKLNLYIQKVEHSTAK